MGDDWGCCPYSNGVCCDTFCCPSGDDCSSCYVEEPFFMYWEYLIDIKHIFEYQIPKLLYTYILSNREGSEANAIIDLWKKCDQFFIKFFSPPKN